MKPTNPPEIAVVLVNLGTPDEPTVPAVRRYLKQFLSDSRVIEIPPFIWQIILNLFICPLAQNALPTLTPVFGTGIHRYVKLPWHKRRCYSSVLMRRHCLLR